ncbi:hypothetical protein [Streptomyces sp. NPDC058476]|uniref:hypothetical protein n=1 Tax=Streptomyces sp. NPDC058476 TaxID=3346519 RepID=UPI00366704DE
MSQEAVPQEGTPAQPKGLLQQMEELMAALNADLSQLDADLSGGRPEVPTGGRPGVPTGARPEVPPGGRRGMASEVRAGLSDEGDQA